MSSSSENTGNTEDSKIINEKCSICLEILGDKSNIQTTPCAHQFHIICLQTWFLRKQNCPQCRTSCPVNGSDAQQNPRVEEIRREFERLREDHTDAMSNLAWMGVLSLSYLFEAMVVGRTHDDDRRSFTEHLSNQRSAFMPLIRELIARYAANA